MKVDASTMPNWEIFIYYWGIAEKEYFSKYAITVRLEKSEYIDLNFK